MPPPNPGESALSSERTHELAEHTSSTSDTVTKTHQSGEPPDAEISQSSTSDSIDLKEKESGPHYAPIRGESYMRNDLNRMATQVFGPLSPHEQGELRQIASLHRSKTTTSIGDQLERKDTLAGIADDDARLNPDNPEFDIYLWARAFMRAIDEGGIKLVNASCGFKDLNVSGSGSALSLQSNVASILLAPLNLKEVFNIGGKPHKQILRNFDGLLRTGEMLIVLGRPGSGCSTFLKTLCGELAGLELDKGSVLHYDGISQRRMMKEFKGEIIYNQEVDKHFPHLTVGETLSFAAAARTPQSRVRDITRQQYIEHMTKVIMAVFGLTRTRNTKVGNEYIRGVSGGERKV